MSSRHSRRRAGLRAILAACLGVIALAGLTAAYASEPGAGKVPGSVEISALNVPGSVEISALSTEPRRAPAGRVAAADVRSGVAGTSSYAPIVRAVEARVAPSDTARVVGRLTTKTPEGTTTIVPVIRRVERGGTLWIEVGVPVLPNGTTGWVPRSALGGYGFVTARLEISLRTLRAVLYRGSKRVFSAPIGIGKSQWPTPTGRFIIRNKLTKYASPTYGPVAFGINARSAVLTDWPAGGFVGIHGTNRPSLIPGRISHGCIRLRNTDILRLERLMPLGTPVTIR